MNPSTRLATAVRWAATVVLLALVAAAVLVIGVDNVLRLAGALALVAVAATALAVLALLRRIRRLGLVEHLPFLGHRFETHYEDAQLVDIASGPTGSVALIATASSQTIVLDQSGAPEQVRAGEAGIVRCPLTDEDATALRAVAQADSRIRLTAGGVMGPTGPVTTSWEVRTPSSRPGV